MASEAASVPAVLATVPRSSAYTRMFSSAIFRNENLVSVSSSALEAKSPAGISKFMSSIALLTKSKAGKSAVVAVIQKEFAATAKITSAKLLRARILRLPDEAVDIAVSLKFSGGALDVGEVWVEHDSALSFTVYVTKAFSAGDSLALRVRSMLTFRSPRRRFPRRTGRCLRSRGQRRGQPDADGCSGNVDREGRAGYSMAALRLDRHRVRGDLRRDDTDLSRCCRRHRLDARGRCDGDERRRNDVCAVRSERCRLLTPQLLATQLLRATPRPTVISRTQTPQLKQASRIGSALERRAASRTKSAAAASSTTKMVTKNPWAFCFAFQLLS